MAVVREQASAEKGLGMEASKTDIVEFIPQMEAMRENLVDELICESRLQVRKNVRDKNPARLDQLTAELADVQIAIVALREEAERRR
ncbi:hypothetical protein L598_002600000030 [Mesorhizobium sp. J18]|uniref:hypothetical protein n=1 Tax=Mesorhizobium sp. J18 TaxID=935263 RepID=UPI001199FD42|nr:hypothetical protein [Mesorhizobium sp. J18]TWG96373.1 hypothetical protein L598_002600000030 [Mesorhizobium sp. J18]